MTTNPIFHSKKMNGFIGKFLLFIPFFLASFVGMAQRLLAPFPAPTGVIRVIIDTDAANEVDDQWAIALALGFPERLKIEGFVAAHYGLRGGSKGIEKSYKNILELLQKANSKDTFPIKKGSDPLVYRDKIAESEGVDFIIEKARSATPENPIWVLALGPATDVASALIKDPSIINNIVVFWHGRTIWPDRCWNFNAYNDIKAVQVLFDLPTRFVLFDTGTFLTMPMEESENRVASQGVMGQYLHDIRKPSAYARRADKGFFDLGDIAALIDERTVRWETTEAPGVEHDLRYDFTRKNGRFIRIYHIEREASFSLLDEALQRLSKGK